MRYGYFAVAVVSTLLVACEGERRRPAATTVENRKPVSPLPSTPSPNAVDVPGARSEQHATAATAAARQYPSFPDSLTEVPPWNDANPPFDLAEFLKVPPAEENAAPFYLDALFEFEELSFCYVPSGLEWSQYPDEVKRRVEIARKRWKECSRIDEAWEKDPKSVDMAAVDAWLSEYDVGFHKLAAAQQHSPCIFQMGLRIDSLLAHAQAVRQVARVALWRTRRDLERGDFERPIRDLTTVLRLSRDLRPRGNDVCQLVSIAVDGICCNQIVPLILTAPDIEVRHCDQLLTLLAEHEGMAVDPLGEAERAAYFIDRSLLHDLQHRTGTFDPNYMKEDMEIRGNVNSWMTCIKFIGEMSGFGPMAAEKQKTLARASGAQPSNRAEVARFTLLPGAWTGGKMLADGDYAKEVDALNRVYTSILELTDDPNMRRQDPDFDAILTPLYEPLRETTLAVFLPGTAAASMISATKREEATLRGTQCLIALRRWQLEHEGLPKDFETLVKAAGMRGTPIDACSGQPLQMTVIWGEPVIYSVGRDGKDDHGRVEAWDKNRRNWQGDLVFRLVASPASARTWTDNTGKHSIEAELVEVNNGNVVLRKANGKTTILPLDKLSQADREYLTLVGKNSEEKP